LYRNDAWVSYKRRDNNQESYPEFYVYFTPTHYEYGMGYYSASKKVMDKFREILENNPEKFEQSIPFFSDKENKLEILGEQYKKVVKNSAKEEWQTWFQFKTFAVSKKSEIDDIFFSQEIEKEIRSAFEKLKLLYCFLLEHTTDND
jgi:hypothetical protein